MVEKIVVSCVGGATVTVNGEPTSQVTLAVGDSFEIDGHNFSVIQPPGDHSAAISAIYNKQNREMYVMRSHRIMLTHTLLAKRWPSYVLSLLVLFFAFLLPYANRFGNLDQKLDEDIVDMLPTDHLWLSGPLISAHELEIGDDCSVCHITPFQQVRDKECIECHSMVGDHFKSQTALALFKGEFSCQYCHKEHNEPATLVVNSNALCTDCHGDFAVTMEGNIEGHQMINHQLMQEVLSSMGEMKNITGFHEEAHTPFRFSMLLPTEGMTTEEWEVGYREDGGCT